MNAIKDFFRSFRTLGEMFRPPFNGLWLLVTLYYAWAFFVYPNNPLMRGEFPDTDDYMYLNQLVDWMKGQGWYDNVQHRLDPPNGVPIHFSRLAMLPMAAITYMFELVGFGIKGSSTLMAMVYPVILLGAFFCTLRWAAQSYMPKEWAGATAFCGLFATHTLSLFQPGHIDHHGLIVVVIVFAIGCVARMMQQPQQYRWPLYAGLAMAVGNTVALEILPWLLLLSVFVGLWAAVKGANAARGGLLYGVTLLVGSALCLLVTRPWSDIGNLDVLTYSVVYVLLTAGIALAFAGVFLAARALMAVRIVVGAVLGGIAGGLFLHRFPEMISGPYGGIDPALARIILDEIVEAQPMKMADITWFAIFLVMGSLCLAVPMALYSWWKAAGLQRWLWSLWTMMLLVATALTMFYQRRFAGTMNMLEILPLAVLLQQGWGWVGAHWRGRRQFIGEAALILLAGPLLPVFLPALYDGRSFNTGIFLFPVGFGAEEVACQSYQLENALRDPLGLGSRPRLIMNPMGEGPEFLYRTNHQILAAPFHMDVEGNVDSTRFFSTPYPDEAEAIVRRRHVDLVVACMYAASFYFDTTPWQKPDDPTPMSKDFAPHFIERLLTGHIPPWLRPVKIPGLTNYVVYEVLPPLDSGKK